MIGASAAGAGAFATSPYAGSDSLYNVTNQAILNSQLGNNPFATSTPPQWNSKVNPIGDYGGGGSGSGESALVGNKQQTAPMGRMFASGACSAADLSQASGVVLAIDAVGVWAAKAVVGANAACNGATGTGPCTPDPSGLAFSSAGGNTSGFTNWRDALALLYGGLDRSTGVTDCNSTKRQTLISNWANLFQNSGCTNGAITHAWRRDDSSGAADTFANLIGIEAAWKDPAGNSYTGFNVSLGAVNGFGTSPYCNALNWDQAESKAASCSNTAPNHYIGPGGNVGPDGKHHLPPTGTYGSVATGSQPFVLSTSFQDNDPIRTTCVGNGSAGRAAEDVCNADGKLGVVVPISNLDFIPSQNPGLVAFPSSVQCTGGTSSGAAPRVFQCAPRGHGTFFGVSQCPNGDTPFAFGCLIPVGPGSGGPTSQCITIKSEFPTLCNVGPCSTEGRIYNAQIYDGTGAGAIAYLSLSVPESGFSQTLSHAGGWARVHMREVSTAGTKNCQLTDADDQIGCLVQADTHSVGIGGNGVGTWESRDPIATHTGAGETVGLRVNQLEPGISCTPAAPGAGPSYPLWRKMYISSLVGFGRVTAAAELELAEFESFDQNLAPLTQKYGFFALPFGPNGTDSTAGNTPNPFCEDFNEQLVCGKTSNQNGCAFNTATAAVGGGPLTNTTVSAFTSLTPGAVATPGCAGLPAGAPGCTIPSDPSATPGSATTSTVCGNGIVEAYEDCDPSPPASSPNCTTACRSTL
jgi:hypothetical protein